MNITIKDMIKKTEKMLDIIEGSERIYEFLLQNPDKYSASFKEAIEQDRKNMIKTLGVMYINYEAEFFEEKDRIFAKDV